MLDGSGFTMHVTLSRGMVRVTCVFSAVYAIENTVANTIKATCTRRDIYKRPCNILFSL